MVDLDGFRIAVAGLGLMGGSLAMALKQSGSGCTVFGLDVRPETVARAQALGVIDAPCTDAGTMDMVVLAMPVRKIIEWLCAHGAALPERTIVMDIGSTKRDVVASMSHLKAQCIGGHPMCGKETAGLDSAEAGLFRGARFVLTPTARTTEHALAVAHALVAAVGAEPMVMDAEAHDRAVAAISHAPYLLSVGLVNAVAGLPDDPRALAAGGYRGMTRLAASDLHMMGDIVATNSSAIIEMLDRCQREISALRNAIAAGDEATWQAMMARANAHKRQG